MLAFLLRFIRSLVVLSAIIPLIRSSTSFYGEVVDRTLAFYLITQLITLAWMMICTLDHSYLPRFRTLTAGIGLWILTLITCTIFAQNTFLSLFSTFERMNGLLTYLHLFFYFLVVSCVLNQKDWRNVLAGIFCVGLISSMLGLVWRSENTFNGRITATLGNPSFVASYTIFQIFITFLFVYGIWKTAYKKWAVPVFIFAVLVHTTVLIVTGSRSGLLGLVAGSFVCALLVGVLVRKYRFCLLSFSILLPVIFLVVRISGPALPRQLGYLSRLFELSISTDTFLVRRKLWGVAWNAFLERPLIGWGFEGFSVAFLKYYDPSLYKDGLWYDNPHNIFLEWAVNGGVLGFAGFLFCFILGFLLMWRNNSLPTILKSIVTGFGVSYTLFNFNNFDSLSTIMLLFLLWGFIESQEIHNRPAPGKSVGISSTTNLDIRLLGVVLILLSIYFFTIKSYQVNKALFRANLNPDLEVAKSEYIRLYEKAWIGKLDILVQAGLRSTTIDRNTANEVVQGYYLTILPLLEAGLDKYPESGQMLNQLGHFNVTFGQLPKAIPYFEKLRKIAPRRQANLMDLGTTYLESSKTVQAVDIFNYVYSLDKHYQESLIYKAIGMSRLDHFPEALATLGKVSPETLGRNGQLVVLAFEKSGRTDEFCKIYSGMSERDRQFINQNTYWIWMNVAFETKDFVQLRTAFNCYRYAFNIPEQEIMPILEDATERQIRPVAIQQFFERNPGR